MNKNIFREYDIRGVYPIDLNEDIYFEIGNAIASKCNQLSIDSIVIGRDGRLSGEPLMNALKNSLLRSKSFLRRVICSKFLWAPKNDNK